MARPRNLGQTALGPRAGASRELEVGGRMIGVNCGAATHVGHVRGSNQDAYVVGPPVFAIADGMGGHAGGDVASAMIVARLASFDGASAVESSSVISSLQLANEDILERARTDDRCHDMGSTVTGIALSRENGADAIFAFNAGDSRVYRYHNDAMSQLTDDHSVVAAMVEAGAISAEEARGHPRRSEVTNALGILDVMMVDTWAVAPRGGDRYLVCSDGLTSELTDEAITNVLASESDPTTAANALVEASLSAGGHDNVSVLVVDLTSVQHVTVSADEDTNPRQHLPRLRTGFGVGATP